MLPAAIGYVPGPCVVNEGARGSRALGGRFSTDDEVGRHFGTGVNDLVSVYVWMMMPGMECSSALRLIFIPVSYILCLVLSCLYYFAFPGLYRQIELDYI